MAMIQAPDPFEGINSWLGKLLAAKQQQEVHKEQLKLREKELELQGQEFQQKKAMEQAELAQRQGPQLAAQQFLQAQAQQAALPAMAQYSPMGGVMMGDPMKSSAAPAPQAAVQYGQMQADPQTKLAAAPEFAKQAQAQIEDMRFQRLMTNARKYMPAEQADGWMAAVEMVRAGVPKEQVDFMIPLNAKETMALLKDKEDIQRSQDARASGLQAQATLKSMGIDVPPERAVEMLNNTLSMKQSFANAWALQSEREKRADARALLSRQTDLEKTLNSQFQQSPVVRAAQTGVKEIVRIRELSVKKNGLADKGMVYSYIKMLDDMTGVREGETKDTAKAASAAERVQGLIGRWKEGDLLTDAQRDRLLDASEAIVASHRDRTFKDYYDWVARNAQESGVDIGRVAYNPYANLESPEKFKARAKVDAAGIR